MIYFLQVNTLKFDCLCLLNKFSIAKVKSCYFVSSLLFEPPWRLNNRMELLGLILSVVFERIALHDFCKRGS